MDERVVWFVEVMADKRLSDCAAAHVSGRCFDVRTAGQYRFHRYKENELFFFINMYVVEIWRIPVGVA
ncbi:hypothetical protein [Burkholderia multivorans]|uniref:hypothetical protein n=1 Tax=Burkholderia multivorans TaxID=87883 RepID=UPI003736F617